MAAVSAWGKPGAWALDSEENESELIQQHKDDSSKPISDFPSLSVAATTKTKKKKPQSFSLSEFTTFVQPKGLTQDEILSLPTAPRERSAEELDRSKFGGGFRSYASDREPRRSVRHSEREFTPSRADETDDWKKSKSTFGGGFERKEKGGFFTSRADDVDNWASKKSVVVSKYDRDDVDNWASKKSVVSKYERSGMDWGKKREEVSESVRPKLNLKPRTKPLEEDVKSEVKGSSNPFGVARPREEVLKEKGKDWKEIEDKFESVKINEKNGNGRFRGEERAWRKTEFVGDSRTQSDAGSENGHAEKTENGHTENTENGHTESTENSHAENTENGHAEDRETQMLSS